MENDWTTYSIADIADVKSGKRLPKGHSLTSENTSLPYIRLVDIENNIIDENKLLFLKKKTQELISRYIVNSGDVCLAIVGHTIGLVFWVENKFEGVNLTENAARITNFSNEINPKYLFYYLLSPYGKTEILSRKVGSAQGKLPLYNIRSLEIKVPTRTIQDRVVDILDGITNKIELNRQMNQTLEQMAQALFKSWFVDFDPVIDNALDAGKPIPEELQAKTEQRKALGKNRKTLPEEIQKLFPNEFEYREELEKWVPLGWRVRSVEDCIDVNPSIKLVKGSTAKFVDMKALPTTGYSISEVITKELTSGGSKYQQGDVLLARITPCLQNGKTGIVDFLQNDEAGFGSTEFIVLRGKETITTPFVACLARNDNFRKHCMQSMVGSSGRQRVQNACFLNYFLSIPENVQVLKQFHQITVGYFDMISKKTAKSNTLTTLRDTLLPKLISGELRVPNLIMGDE